MKIPDTSTEALQAAMNKFDSELRSMPLWERWQEDENYKYAIKRNGQLYPVKQIVSMATGVPVSGFSGGDQANGYVEKYGLTTVEIRPPVRGIRTNLQAVLSKYKEVVGSEPFGKESSIWPIFGALQRSLKALEVVKKHPDLDITWSAGQGNWARIPWIAILNRYETKTTQTGVYCVFLFRQDMSGVYLTFNQGVEQLNQEHGHTEAREVTHRRAEELRKQASGLVEKGFLLDDNIDLRTDGALGKDYQCSTIAYKFYETNSIPDDVQIHVDLDSVITAYEGYLSSKGMTKMSNWVFQASPQFYDLQGALKALKEQTWLTSQYRTDIHKGDRVFLWEAGSDAGILGVATVLSEPKEMAHPDSEKPFMKDQEKFAGLQPRVSLRIDKILESRLRKVDLLQDPVLNKLRVIANPRGTNYPLSTEEAQRLEVLVGMTTQTEPAAVPPANTDRFGELVRRSFLPQEFFKDLETLLITKQQVILQGAPGTGKTFVAKELANWWAGNTDRVQIVQFHESYGYEDFVEGFKPKEGPNGAGPQFVPTPGPFSDVCKLARSVPDQKPVVLIIDEINRAKTSRVFGELLYLLEYRKEQITLQNNKSFSISGNLFVLGTMNTVDKSIALVDYALRRRFAFVTLNPVVDGKSVVLRKWLAQKGIENADELEDLFVALNRLVSAKDESLMIGHSYFMTREIEAKKKVTEDDLRFIWTYYILPLVREYEYELTAKEVEEKYGYNAIKKTTK
jgi:MoxR-like ATPase